MVLYSGRVVAERVLEYIEKYRITKLAGVPSLYRVILGINDCEKKYDLSSLESPKNIDKAWLQHGII